MLCLPENLRLIRKKWRLNQDEFGDLFGVKRDTVRRFEAGEQELPLGMALKLEELTGVSVWRICNKKMEAGEVPAEPGKVYRAEPAVAAAAAEPERLPDYGKPSTPGLADVLAELRELRAENEKLRKEVDILRRKMDYFDEELLRLGGRKK